MNAIIAFLSEKEKLDDDKIKNILVGEVPYLEKAMVAIGPIESIEIQKEFERVYTNFSNRKFGHQWAEKLGVTACPYCNRSYIFTVKKDARNGKARPQYDHFFPKSKYPYEAPAEKISVGAERQRRYRAMKKLRAVPTEEHLWEVVLMYQKVRFKTYSGLPFTYEVRKGRSGEYTKELWIDRRENSKSLAWSSVLLALGNVKEIGAVIDRPKALGDIRGVTYIYGMFYRFGLIDVPDDAKCKLNRCRCVSKG